MKHVPRLNPFTFSSRRLLPALVLSVALPALRGAEADSAVVDRLIRQLGSDQFSEREAAFKALTAMGEAALPALQEALRNPDAEVRSRVARLVEVIQDRLEARLRGWWKLRVEKKKSRYVLMVWFRPKGAGQIMVLQPDGDKEDQGPASVYGFGWKLEKRMDKSVLLIEGCLGFPGGKASIPCVFTDGKMTLERGSVKAPDRSEVDLKGDWQREEGPLKE